MASTRERRSAHDPGVVLRDLAVMLADGGECLADLGALRDQADLFGGVASDATAFRVIDRVDEQCLDRLRLEARGAHTPIHLRRTHHAPLHAADDRPIHAKYKLTSSRSTRRPRYCKIEVRQPLAV